ncbi:MAG: HIT domain-containing protein [Longimicrobiales bacterium]
MTPSDCLFCRIAAGEIPAAIAHADDQVMAFQDINPQAPVHVLVIPRQHITSLDHAEDGQGALLGRLLLAARDVARKEGLAENGYRTVINTGDDGGQSVHHVHVHVLGGRALDWPPG